ncbi:GTP cyclohydrolase [Lacinutrix sp. C3R15]|uniref:GTP cyclohydrolase n=1 Tax=Flavobacteriaceae TaxID=49546 RepID=UPI001C0A2EA4|nr:MULTISPECIES: GTP cyclohydrolase [Flavobacteriaceae]MBU2940171.1 GTP cyclohydrolase [Lacinutrix sp. C3R15]MDO6623488.1 GTP cyclohydrolase [Oceanihabitans sp. 1_MG-2023]
MITIKQVHTKKEFKAFVKFPFTLYKDSKYWVPPIISQELKTFDKNENPVFNDADASFFLAYKDNKIVGRVAAIINWLEVNNQNIKKMRFGWFDFIDDLEVSKALLDKVTEIGKQNNLEYTEGPVGFSNLDKVGVLTEGFDVIGTMITWYNHPYYAKHLEKLNYKPEKEWIESHFPFGNINPESFSKANALIQKRYQVKAKKFTKTAEVMPYADEMFDLFNNAYASLSSFVEITDIQKAYFKKKFISFINPEYIKFVFDKNDKMIAFAIVMPSFSKALQEINGKLFPFGFLKLLKAKKESKDVIFYLIGIDPEYQNKGITAIIFNEYYNTFKEKGIQNCIRTPELADNTAIQQIWKHFNPKIIKRRKTFRKEIV